MSKKYIIQKGDTLSRISQRFYGTPCKYMDIFNSSNFKSGNPDLIYPGEIAYIPEIKTEKPIKYNFTNIFPDEVIVVVNGEVFYGWQANAITLSMLEFADKFSFSFPWDETLREFLVPYTYPEIQIYIGNDLIISGQIELMRISATADTSTINIQGRSKIGLALGSQLDLVQQYNNQQLSIIAQETLTLLQLIWNFF